MMDLSPVLRRFIAIALIVLPAIFAYQHLVSPLVETYYGNDEQVQKGRFVLARYRAISSQDRGDTNVNNSTKIADHKKNFFIAKNEVIASANIQSKLKSLASRYGVTVLRANRIAKKKQGELTLIGVNAELVGIQKNLHKLIHAIEANQPFLFVHRLQLSPQRFRPGRKQTRDIQLRTILHVYGAFWVGEGA